MPKSMTDPPTVSSLTCTFTSTHLSHTNRPARQLQAASYVRLLGSPQGAVPARHRGSFSGRTYKETEEVSDV